MNIHQIRTLETSHLRSLHSECVKTVDILGFSVEDAHIDLRRATAEGAPAEVLTLLRNNVRHTEEMLSQELAFRDACREIAAERRARL